MPPRARLVYLHDVIMATLSLFVSLYLRLGDGVWSYISVEELLRSSALFAGCAAVAFYTQRMYIGIWRYASLEDLIAIFRGVTLALVLFLPALFLLSRLDYIPRSILFINWFVLMAMLGAPRFFYRFLKDRKFELRRQAYQLDSGTIPVLLVGAGDACEMFLRSVIQDSTTPYVPVGIVAENETRVGRRIRGQEVLGTLEQLTDVVRLLKARGQKPHKLILTKDDMDPARVSALLDDCAALGMSLARMPRVTELKSGLKENLVVRPVALEDLLGRPQTVLNRDPVIAMARGRRVLITGAGGSIGSELVRQIADLDPSRLLLADSSEFALYTIDMEIGERFPDLSRRALIADVRDVGRIESIMAQEKPELVFHAAALKHVPMVEMNPLEGLRTNALGTQIVANASRRHGVRTMVLISTDKAVNPTNVMGAAKRMAETWCQALDLDEKGNPLGTHFVTVRFGNVLGSTGSVVPLFQRQLAKGGPLTVTHPDITRFFMTIREAVELVLQAAALGSRADTYRGSIFVLDMGEPVKIAELAKQMIRLAGLRPDDDVKIAYTGLRPGEKLYEEIFHGKEKPLPTPTNGILVAEPRALDARVLEHHFATLEQACLGHDLGTALDVLGTLVPEFSRSLSTPPPEKMETTEPSRGEGISPSDRAVSA
ncbi:MAG: polysaccharide biosynthesis protein [Rhodospirillum sp.]|nr:polysaccharide biosynthesis protein [Rhodospirillum sp.]MCF8487645.1 polysaccharide biosynthesis protein [Rhodospirillum sp.]MCF8503087.1 polysaccharide biosynthesis protein [Rhodospirillum sp.]